MSGCRELTLYVHIGARCTARLCHRGEQVWLHDDVPGSYRCGPPVDTYKSPASCLLTACRLHASAERFGVIPGKTIQVSRLLDAQSDACDLSLQLKVTSRPPNVNAPLCCSAPRQARAVLLCQGAHLLRQGPVPFRYCDAALLSQRTRLVLSSHRLPAIFATTHRKLSRRRRHAVLPPPLPAVRLRRLARGPQRHLLGGPPAARRRRLLLCAQPVLCRSPHFSSPRNYFTQTLTTPAPHPLLPQCKRDGDPANSFYFGSVAQIGEFPSPLTADGTPTYLAKPLTPDRLKRSYGAAARNLKARAASAQGRTRTPQQHPLSFAPFRRPRVLASRRCGSTCAPKAESRARFSPGAQFIVMLKDPAARAVSWRAAAASPFASAKPTASRSLISEPILTPLRPLSSSGSSTPRTKTGPTSGSAIGRTQTSTT